MAVSKIRRIPPVPIAMAVGLVNGVLGLIFGILNAIGLAFINDWVQRLAGVSATVLEVEALSPINVGVGLIIGYPIGGFVIGFLGTLIVISAYNVVAKRSPIHLEIK